MSDWIEWNGGECPVPEDTVVEVKIRRNTLPDLGRAGDLVWSHHWGAGDDIVAYRVPNLVTVDRDVSRQDHYTGHTIQPIEYIVGNGMGFLEGNVVKYVTRYKAKNGIGDLKKARVYLDWLIEREESGTITAHK